MPSLPALATAADMEDYGYSAVGDGVLARASVRVRRYLRQQVTAGSSTVTVRGIGPWRLPQRPVTAVTSVLDADGDEVPAKLWELRGQLLHAEVCSPLTVAWQHGFGVLPDELVETVCAIATRLGSMPAALGAGVRTEQAGGEAVTWGAEAFAAVPGLTAAEQAALDKIYPRVPPLPIQLV